MNSSRIPPAVYGDRAKPTGPEPVRRAVAARAIVAVADVTQNNLGQVRKLNSALFPIAYTDKVYTDLLHDDVRQLCKLGLFNDIPAGDICCRLEDGSDPTKVKVYIMTLGVLPPYRRLGIASALLRHVVDHVGIGSLVSGRRVESIYLHVQTGNEAARQFYEAFGFSIVDTVPQYYRELVPPSAWVLAKTA
ncbi:N-terminal methionine N(alpha)-acetyltransferase NatE [Malassezia sp. CBS 17886]|nr:N-terminal methionine N(alpha)-acetyltransferase NatE [Malassezia sp. CBS 17886]